MNRQSYRPAGLIAVAGAALLVAACGSGPSSPGSGSSPSAGAAAQSTSLVAFAQCMRSHGVSNFPDADGPRGTIQQMAQQLGVSAAQLQSASNSCISLNPKANAASQQLTAQQEQDYLRAAACMRSHGIPNFPDPSFSGGHVSFTIPSSISTNSPQVTQALNVCQKLIPAGLPYSGTS